MFDDGTVSINRDRGLKHWVIITITLYNIAENVNQLDIGNDDLNDEQHAPNYNLNQIITEVEV